jgi:hypothetical protein
VVESAGVTDCDPLKSTLPIPSMLTSVAFSVRHVSVTAWPFSTLVGFADSVAVGAGGGGGGVTGAGGGFFLQAASVMTSISAATVMNVLNVLCCFTQSSMNAPKREPTTVGKMTDV